MMTIRFLGLSKIEIDEDKASLTSAEWVDNYLKKTASLK